MATQTKERTTLTTFTVCIQRYVEETATIEVEAEDAEKALALATVQIERDGNGITADWTSGDDIDGPEIYAIMTGDSDVVWDRDTLMNDDDATAEER